MLDTSFFGDYSSYPEIFLDFVNTCKENEITFVTNVPVVTEFSKGSDTELIFSEKTALIKKVVDYLLPVTPAVFQTEVPWLTDRYGQAGRSVSTTDFILAAQTKIHVNDLCLVTKNPHDFPMSLFSVKTYFLIQLERALQVYGIYYFDPK